MQTLPVYNLVTLILICQVKSKPKCPICGSTRFWRHGWYYRKGTFFTDSYIPVQRCLCLKCPKYKTFSLLPSPLLRYVRFSLWHLLQIDELEKAGHSKKRIAKGFTLNPAVVQRILAYLIRVFNFIEDEVRTLDHFNPLSHFSKWIATVKSLSWWEMCKRFSLALYPKRYRDYYTNTIKQT